MPLKFDLKSAQKSSIFSSKASYARGLVTFICALLLFSACSSSHTTSKLRLNISSEPQTLDPRKVRNLNDITLMKMLFEGLTRLSVEEKPELALAQEVSVSEDFKTYIFKLRETKWTNGDALSAEDFVYAWKKVLDPHFPSDNAFYLYSIKNAKLAKSGKIALDELGIHALDALTLQVELEAPTPYFLELLSIPVFFPVNRQVDRETPDWFHNRATYVSNGPFSLVNWEHNDTVSVEKNKTYWDVSTVQLQGIEMLMVEDEISLNMYEKNELDWAGSPLSTLPLDAILHFKETQDLEKKPFLSTAFIRINTQAAPLDHKLLRRALSLAVNRKEMIDHVMQGGQTPATSMVPPIMGLRPVTYFTDGDQIEALSLFKQVLEERSVTIAKFPEITLLFATSDQKRRVAQAIQDQWFHTFGIQVKLEAVESKVYFDRVSHQDYQLALGDWIADFNDPIQFLEIFKSKMASTNNTHWEDQEYGRLLDASVQVREREKRFEILRQSENVLMEAMPIIPIYHPILLYLKKDRVKNVALSSLGSLDFKWAYLEEKQK